MHRKYTSPKRASRIIDSGQSKGSRLKGAVYCTFDLRARDKSLPLPFFSSMGVEGSMHLAHLGKTLQNLISFSIDWVDLFRKRPQR